MVLSELNEDLGYALIYFAAGGREVEDYDAYVKQLRTLSAKMKPGWQSLLVVLEAGVPAPSAVSRQKLAEGTSGIGKGARVALVTASWWISGLATATGWLRPRLWEQRVFANEGTAIEWLATDAVAAKALRDMIVRARAAASAKSTSGRPSA